MRISPRTIFITLDLILVLYLLLAVTSFNKMDDENVTCSGVNITISDKNDAGFLSAADIEQSLKQKNLYPDSTKKIMDISPRTIEEELLKDPFISNVQCYKARNNMVNINVEQRTPVVRVKSENGEDYYVDARDSIMPRTKYQSNLLVATGNITKYYAQNYVAPMSRYITDSELWNNQIEQIYIRPDKGVELIPRVGDHIVNIGRPPESNDRSTREKDIEEFMQRKMQRLEKFYRYGLSETGWDTYSYINLEFDNQIICKRRDGKHHDEVTQQKETPSQQDKPKEQTVKENKTDKDNKKDNNDGKAKPDPKKTEKKSPDQKKTEKSSEKKKQ